MAIGEQGDQQALNQMLLTNDSLGQVLLEFLKGLLVLHRLIFLVLFYYQLIWTRG